MKERDVCFAECAWLCSKLTVDVLKHMIRRRRNSYPELQDVIRLNVKSLNSCPKWVSSCKLIPPCLALCLFTVCVPCGAFREGYGREGARGGAQRQKRGSKCPKVDYRSSPRGGLSMHGEVTLNPFMTQIAQIQVPVRF